MTNASRVNVLADSVASEGDFRLRRGLRVKNHLYVQSTDDLTDGDHPSVAWAITPEYAAQAVAAVNDGAEVIGAIWWHNGRLIYCGDIISSDLTRDWIIAVESEELAARICRALRRN